MFRTAIAALLLAAVSGWSFAASPTVAETVFGKSERLGNGTARSYALLGASGNLTAIGVSFTEEAVEGLPERPNRTSRCFDLDGNGRINEEGECDGDYELRLMLPAALDEKPDVPFRWIGVNWNAHGHPPLPWSVPHFDFHFYMVGIDEIDAIRVGACDFFIDCDDRETAMRPVDAALVHPDHVSVGATVSKMGDHLIDSKTPELGQTDPPPFTHTWIFGAYDGKITFYEPMITLAHLRDRLNGCTPIKQPGGWEMAGYYPTGYCIRYSREHANYTVSLEGMVLRNAR